MLLASWSTKRTYWLAIIWAVMFAIAVGLLVGLLVRGGVRVRLLSTSQRPIHWY